MRHKDFWIALGLGALAGGIAALLYAPQSGVKTRKQIKRNIADASDALDEATVYLKTQAEHLSEQAQKLIEQGKTQFTSAVDAATEYAETVTKAANVFAETASKTAGEYAQSASDLVDTATKAAKKKLA